MGYEVIVALRENCGACMRVIRCLPGMQRICAEAGTTMRRITPDQIPKNVLDSYPGVPLIMFTDVAGNILVDKSILGFNYPDNVEGLTRFMNMFGRWILSVRTNNV